MSLPETWRVSPEVMARRVADETVLLDLASGNYFGLDPVGSRIWELLSAGTDGATLRCVLLAEFEVAPEVLEADLQRLLGELLTRGLIQAG